MVTPEEADTDLLDELICCVANTRDDYRQGQRRIIARWRGLRKRGEVIEDAEEARDLLRTYSVHVAACDRWFKANA
jgi:hypothetical protein